MPSMQAESVVTLLTNSTIPLLVPGTPEHRTQPFVSASTAACLFGCHDFCDVPKLAAIRRGEVEDTAGEAAATGNLLEDVVAQWWADEHGVTVVRPTVTYVCGPLSASPDRLIVGSADLLEVKTTSKAERPLPAAHWWQAQCQMACTGAPRVHFAMLFGGSLTLRSLVVPRDDDAIAELTARAEAFLAHLDMGLEPPEPAEVEPVELRVQVGEGEAALFAQVAILNETARDATAEAKPLKAQLLALVGAPAMTAGSRVVAVDAEGRPVGRVRVQRGRERTVGTGSFGPDFAVIEAP